MANYNGPPEAVDRHIHSVRYDMVGVWYWRPSQIGPHQVTYEAATWLIFEQKASVVADFLLYYRIHFNGSLESVDRHIQIRYGVREREVQIVVILLSRDVML